MSPAKSYIYHKTYQEVKDTVSLPKFMTIRKRGNIVWYLVVQLHTNWMIKMITTQKRERQTFRTVWKFISALESQFDLIRQFQGAEITDLLAICFWVRAKGFTKKSSKRSWHNPSINYGSQKCTLLFFLFNNHDNIFLALFSTKTQTKRTRHNIELASSP